MNIGELKHRITIQRKINNNNPLTDATFEDFKTVWAKVNNLYGKEFIESQKVMKVKIGLYMKLNVMNLLKLNIHQT